MDWTTGIILFFLLVSTLLYVLLGGADFGAGILELFIGNHPRKKDQIDLMGHAIAPVWEANHVWLILAVVILFMGFPPVYTNLSIYLHIPIILALMGIVVRGCAFTFRHYDPYSPGTFTIYSYAFRLGSLITPFLLGTIIGAITLGKIDLDAETFYESYVAHWLNPFSLSLGAFTCSLCAFLAAAYLAGEAKKDEELKAAFVKKARFSAFAMVILGGACFFFAYTAGSNFVSLFLSRSLSLAAFVLATALLIPLFWGLRRSSGIMARMSAVLIVTFIMLGWARIQFPYFIKTSDSSGLTISDAAAPEATLKALLWALIVGSLFIFPALGYLLKIFKWDLIKESRENY